MAENPRRPAPPDLVVVTPAGWRPTARALELLAMVLRQADETGRPAAPRPPAPPPDAPPAGP